MDEVFRMKPFRATQDLSAETTSLRQALFLATGAGIMIAGTWLMFHSLGTDGITPIECTLLAMFVVLFGQIAFGFTIAFWGFVISLGRGDSWQIMRTLPENPEEELPGSTAVVMPIYNEEPGRIFSGLENMARSLEATGATRAFDFFILSDSNNPDRWIEEESAWLNLCSRLNAFGRIFYRKRRVSLHGKSGNIADFCRRWGKRYRYLIILDADSLMTGECILRLARVMDANPTVGIVQTAPQIVRGTSLLQRLVQFATRSVGPIFAAGSNFWHLGGGNYWGHNAIIRLQPFMEHCVLPELPGKSAKERHILSHDTVEAALMGQAGYQVWFAYLESGSYEEGPPNFSESLKRDRRWCQGNLQHFWFLFAPATRFENRVHIFFGLMAYLSAPILVAFITLSAIDHYRKAQVAFFSSISLESSAVSVGVSFWLLGMTIALLFLPKVFGTLLLLRKAANYGGAGRVIVSSFLETLFSVLLAPILLYFYTRFVILTLLGLRIDWKTQNRSQSAIPLSDAIREYGMPTLVGISGSVAALMFTPGLLLWLSPLLAGLVFCIPLVMLTSSEKVGGWLRRQRLLMIPEEIDPPELLLGLDDTPPSLVRPDVLSESPHFGLIKLALSPQINSVHIAILRRSKVRTRHKDEALATIRKQLLTDGPDSLTQREIRALLWDADAVARLHSEIWRSPEDQLNPWWRLAMRHYNDAGTVVARQSH
jgi:membrane glycosyltransferase